MDAIESHRIDRVALRKWTDSRLSVQKLTHDVENHGNTHTEGFERCVTHIRFISNVVGCTSSSGLSFISAIE